MSTAAHTLPDQERKDLTKALEAFARDLLVLIKTFSVYPQGHPAPKRVAERLAQWSPTGERTEFSVGITPTRLLVENQFIGSDGSRIATLASLLHGRKVMRLSWGSRVLAEDVVAFASTLSSTHATGQELREQLRSAGVYTIGVVPLDIAKIHGTLSVFGQGAASADSSQSRGLDAWLWLQDDAVQPEDLLQALRSDALWELSGDEPAFPIKLLFQHGRKLDQAMGLLHGPDREGVRDHLLRAGSKIPVADLASIILAEVKRGQSGGEAVSCLLGQLGPEDLVELMASVVALSESASPRVIAAFRNLAPGIDAEQMLSLVEERLSQGEGRAHAVGIWRNLKSFLLDLEEGGFFGDDYLLDLEQLSQEEGEEDASRSTEFSVDPEPHLDWIYFGLAAEKTSGAVARLHRRIQARLHVLSPLELLELITATNRTVPSLFREEPELAREVFAKLIAGVRLLDASERLAAIQFAQDHEELVLPVTLNALLRERRIATRRFLVDVLSALSPKTTESIVSRTLDAPWYYVRNVATVLGRRREACSAQVLEALLGYPHDKVRKEALRGLGKMSGAARNAVVKFARDPSKPADERILAERILSRKKATP